MTPRTRKIILSISSLCAAIAAAILLQTLYFKFTAHPESVSIFTMLHVEPWGRITAGIIELILGITLLLPRTRFLASVGTCLLMAGAIGSHLLVLGTGGMQSTLFLLACTAFITADIAGALVFYLRHNSPKNHAPYVSTNK
jgi:putative oxidoreductase